MKINTFLPLVIALAVLLASLSCKNRVTEADKSNDSGMNTEGKVVGVPIIYETDMTLDVDDVGGLAVLHGLQTEGVATILGVCYNEVHKLAPAAIDAINTYYHRGTIPIGIYSKRLNNPDPSDYYTFDRDYDVDNMAHDLSDNIVADAVDVYKQILKTQSDKSVVIISVGFLNNLHDLLMDPEGYALVDSKVKLLAVMGGLHDDDFNFVRHDLVNQTQYVIENWPGELVVTDAGGDIITGETLSSSTPISNPVRRAFELEWGVGPNRGRSSWDEITTLYAVFGAKYYVEEWDGGGSLRNGYSWNFSAGRRGYAAPKDNNQIEQEIERLMTLAP